MAPSMGGQILAPAGVGTWSGRRTGRPLESIPLAQVSFFTRGLARSNFPEVRSRTYKKSVAICVQQQLTRLSTPICVHQHGRLYGVPVPNVMRRVLEMPFELARLGIQGDIGVGIEIVSRAVVAVEVVPGVARRPVDDAQCRVVSPSEPGGSARMIDVLAIPGLRTRLARFRNGPESPNLLSRSSVKRRDKAAHAIVAARHSGQNQAAGDQRSGSGVVVLPPVRHLGVPQQRACGTIQRDQMRVIGDHEYAVAGHGHAAVHSSRRSSANAPRAAALIVPDRPAGAGVERPAFVGTGDIHDACHHYRSQLEVGGRRAFGRSIGAPGVTRWWCRSGRVYCSDFRWGRRYSHSNRHRK